MDTINVEEMTRVVKHVLDDLGLRLYDINYNEVSRTVRVYIDKEGGAVTISDCKRVSNILAREFNTMETVNSSITLEVSSPGIERSLTRPEHFAWAAGKCVEIDTGDAKIKGYIRDTKKDGVIIAIKSGEQFIPFQKIIKAKLAEEIRYDKRR
jgi:ribosome maturation factor RimP